MVVHLPAYLLPSYISFALSINSSASFSALRIARDATQVPRGGIAAAGVIEINEILRWNALLRRQWLMEVNVG